MIRKSMQIFYQFLSLEARKTKLGMLRAAVVLCLMAVMPFGKSQAMAGEVRLYPGETLLWECQQLVVPEPVQDVTDVTVCNGATYPAWRGQTNLGVGTYHDTAWHETYPGWAVTCYTLNVGEAAVHYANSSAIRLANIFAQHPVWCNRGVNGIEGSLSTAAGFSIVTSDRVFCVIGDLSFFYDQNALWNQNLKGNFRILLLNNGRGGIFNMLPGLEQSPALDRIVAAEHHTSAEGICRQNDVVYLHAEGPHDLHQAIDTLLYIESKRPVLLEVLTDASDDERVYKDFLRD